MNWAKAWLAWILLGVLLELIAVFNKQSGDTLTNQIQKWFGVKPKGSRWLSLLLWLIMIALTLHFGIAD